MIVSLFDLINDPTSSNPVKGPALSAVWSKAPGLTARCLSPLFGFESRPGHVGKLPVTWGKAVVFAGSSGLVSSTICSWRITNLPQLA